MQILLKDLRHAVRLLIKRPGFTSIAVITLALGIGANTAIFSLVNTVLLRPLPVERSEDLVTIYGTYRNGEEDTIFSYLNYKDIRDRNQVLSDALAYRFAPMSLSHQGKNERIWGYLVSGNYFDVLGVKAMIGRTFQPEEDRTRNSHPVAVMSHSAWQRRFAGDPAIVGKTVLINGRSFTVIGIAPKDFVGTEIAYPSEIFVPMMMASVIEPDSDWIDSRDSDNIFVAGRLKPGITRHQAESSLKSLMQQLAKEYPNENQGRGIKLTPVGLFLPQIRDAVILFSWVLMAVVGLVVLIACVNLANLLLARAAERKKEIAIRLALGATRRQLIRQLLTESVLLSLAGGAMGLLLAVWILDFVARIKLPTEISLIFDLRIDWRVMAFTVGLSALTGVLFGLLPALQSTNPNVAATLKDETSPGGYRRSRLRNGLVIAQTALSLLLLICSGLIVRSLQQARSMRPGFNPENAVSATFDVGLQGYDESRGRSFHKQLLDRVRALPGVKSATLTSYIPLSLNFSNTGVYIEGQPPVSGANMPVAVSITVMPDYFKTMGTELRGRDFNQRDNNEQSRVAIINEYFAQRFFPGQEAIGKRFNFTGPADPYWEIIGVAANGKYNSLNEEQKLAVYRPMLRNYQSWTTVVARISGEPQSMIAAIRREINQLDSTLPVTDGKTLKEHMNLPLFPARVAATVLGSFGLLALVLAAIGIYGVMSYAVSQRTREIGLRMALGATAQNVLKMILWQGLKLILTGLAIGIAAAFLLTRFLASMLYGVSATDPITFGIILAILMLVALAACWIPARRAIKVDPMVALRYE